MQGSSYGYPYFNQQYPPHLNYAGPSNPSGFAPYYVRPQSTPFPAYNDLPSGTTTRMPRPKHLSAPVPRRSAMKKPDVNNGVPLSRKRTNSGSAPPSRQRTTSNSKFTFFRSSGSYFTSHSA